MASFNINIQQPVNYTNEERRNGKKKKFNFISIHFNSECDTCSRSWEFTISEPPKKRGIQQKNRTSWSTNPKI
jgi:hypothetical protein